MFCNLIFQDEDSSFHRNDEGQCLSDKIEGLGWQFFEEGLGLSLQEMKANEAQMAEDLYHSSPEKDEVENNLSPEMCNKENGISSSQLCPLNASFKVDGETEGVTDQVNV